MGHCSYFGLVPLRFCQKAISGFFDLALLRFGYIAIAVFPAIGHYSYFGLVLLRFCQEAISGFFDLALLSLAI